MTIFLALKFCSNIIIKILPVPTSTSLDYISQQSLSSIKLGALLSWMIKGWLPEHQTEADLCNYSFR